MSRIYLSGFFKYFGSEYNIVPKVLAVSIVGDSKDFGIPKSEILIFPSWMRIFSGSYSKYWC